MDRVTKVATTVPFNNIKGTVSLISGNPPIIED